MPHETSLLSTIVMGLVVAAVGGFLARRVRLPPIVGYLVAGVAIGPFTPGVVADSAIAGQLAEIGVILLMFGVGLHFSIKDLLAVRRIALPGALGQIAVATMIGVGLAHLWGWNLGAGMVFGLALSCASTVVLLRALEDRNALDTVNGHIAVGWLVVEDLVMVLALVLLPPFAASPGTGPGGGLAARLADGNMALLLALTLAKLAIFLVLVVVVGTRAVPWLLERVARAGSRELFTLAVLALALGIAYGSAELFGVSFALGAFLAGVVLSESDFSHQAAADSLPLKDAFAVLFFVSVGMLFDPSILVREPLRVLVVVAVIVLGKSLVAFAIVIASGYPARTALTVSAGLAQIGEFSFILSGLGLALGLLPPAGGDLILAGALLSIAVNPLVFITVEPVAAWLQQRAGLAAPFGRAGGRLAALTPSDDAGPQDHAIVVGYGRVGGVIGEALKAEGLPLVVIEENRRRVESLRKHGFAAVYGDATAAGVLEAAGIGRARLLVVAAPRGFLTQRIVELARQSNPGIRIAIRTHSVDELAHFERMGVDAAIMGETELAFGLLDYALRSLGLTSDQAHSVVQRIRDTGHGGAFERDSDPDP
jgi:CPA2 family monovalent cation:H+ antiporter-2